MAKRRRKRARRTAPTRRRKRRNARRAATKRHVRRRRHRRASNPRRVRRHRRARRNPGRRHHRRHRARRRNPGFGGIIGNVLNIGVPAYGGAFAANFIDSKFLGDKSTIVRIGAKLLEFVGLSFLSRKFPNAAPAAMAGVIATLGAEHGTMLGGGVPGGPSTVTVKKIAEMVAEDEHLGVLLTQQMRGMGIVIQGMGAASTQQLLEGYGNGMGAYTNSPVGYGMGDSESD